MVEYLRDKDGGKKDADRPPVRRPAPLDEVAEEGPSPLPVDPAVSHLNGGAMLQRRTLSPEFVLQLQRTVGNQVVQRLLSSAAPAAPTVVIQRKEVSVGSEKVEVADTPPADQQEEEEAKKIVADLKANYGIDISSSTVVEGIKAQYTNAPDGVKNALKTRKWRMIELRALVDALKMYAPIMGGERSKSTRKDVGQEVTAIGKGEQAIDTNTPAGKLDTTTLGEYFKGKKAIGLFKASEGALPDFPDEKDQLTGTFVHELAHPLLAYALDEFVKETDGYWTDRYTKSGKVGAEAPPTDYGKTNASEDLSETAMIYVVKPDRLKSGAPKRFAFMEKLGKSWLPPVKDAPQVAPSGAATGTPPTISTPPVTAPVGS